MEEKKEKFRVVIAGGRDFNDYEKLEDACCHILSEKFKTHEVVIISGCARGADSLGEKFAFNAGLEVEKYPAEWDKHGKAAGFIRNKEMVDIADAAICFWDGKSRGTNHTINLAKEKGIPLRVIKY